MRFLRKHFIIENSSSLTTLFVNRLCYSTMYMSVATGKNYFYLYPRQTFLRILCFTTKMRNKCAGKFRRGCSKYTLYTCIIFVRRGWCPKFATGLNIIIGCSSKSIWVIKLSLSQNNSLMAESFWQNNSLVTHILFEL